MMRFGSVVLLQASLSVLLLGCGASGPPKYVVKGKLTQDGNTLTVKIDPVSKAGGWLRLYLKPLDSGADPLKSYEARFNFSEGTFILDGGDGKGIPGGKYKVCVQWKDDFPMGKDKLNDRFSDAKSQLVRDIPVPDNGELDVDVGKNAK